MLTTLKVDMLLDDVPNFAVVEFQSSRSAEWLSCIPLMMAQIDSIQACTL